MIVIVDYMMGNLRSVHKACLLTRPDCIVSSDRKKIEAAEKLILPGVGAFADAINELRKIKIFDTLKKKITSGAPFLGVCLGMQLLFSSSEEAPGVKGLGCLKGEVKLFSRKLKVPHIGWNELEFKEKRCPLFKGVKDKSFVYFCHSYYCVPKEKSAIAAETSYGQDYTSVVWKDNIFGVQFHPEKSQSTGLQILKNFLKL
jgi:glutamine amidotransferase